MKTAVTAALVLLLAAVLFAGAGAAADFVVTTDADLRSNLTAGNSVILGDNIQLTNRITLSSGTMTLDLNGHNLTSAQNQGSFYIDGASFTLNDSVGGGCLVGNGTSSTGGVHVNSGSFTMNGGSITGYITSNIGGGVYVGGTFTMDGGNITNCVANYRAGGVAVFSGCTFTMTGGSISGCSTPGVGCGVLNYGSFTMSGTAVVAENNDVFLYTDANITCSGLTGADAGAKNITLNNFPTGWLGQTIVKNGAGNKSNFALSSAYAGYELKAGTDGHENDLILAAAEEPAYIEVSDWNALVAAASGWTKTDEMRTIVLTADAVNVTGSAGDYTGIPVTGNITIMPAANAATDIRIDANRCGRIFNLSEGSSLTITGNKSNPNVNLNLTNAYRGNSGDGAIYLYSGSNLTITTGVNILNCSGGGKSGGAVVIMGGAVFTMTGGNIINCSADQGGAVYVSGTLIMTGGNIIDCDSWCGGAFYVSGGSLTMSDSNIINCTSDKEGGAIFVECANVIISGGSIKNCTAEVGGAITSVTSAVSLTDCSITGNHADEIGGAVALWGADYMGPEYAAVVKVTGGEISGNTAPCGAGIAVGGDFMEGMDGDGVLVLGGSAAIDDEVCLHGVDKMIEEEPVKFFTNITVSDSGYLGSKVMVNLTGPVVNWAGKTIVKDGAAAADKFTLSPSITSAGYALAAGTGDHANDLVLVEYKAPYVEVNTWASLNKSVAEWTDVTNQRTVVVTADITDRVVDENKDGIEVIGNVKVIAAATGDEIKINGSSYGRIFRVNYDAASLTLAGNGTTRLVLTDGNYYTGSAVYVDSYANLTLEDKVTLTGNNAEYYGGAVFNEGNFLIAGDCIIKDNLAGINGGAVYNCANLTMTGTSRIENNIANANGNGVYYGFGGYSGGPLMISYPDPVFIVKDAASVSENNDVYFCSGFVDVNITAASGYTGSIGNITFSSPIEDWLGKTIVKDGAAAADKFTLSPSITSAGYKLAANGNDLVLNPVTVSIIVSINRDTYGVYEPVNLTLTPVSGTGTSGKYDAGYASTYLITGVTSGVYSLISSYEANSMMHNITKEVTVGTESVSVEFVLLDRNVTTEVNTSQGTASAAPNVAVNGLDAVAAAQNPAVGQTITISFAAEGNSDTGSANQTMLKNNLTNKNGTPTFLNFTVTNTTRFNDGGTPDIVTLMPSIGTVLTIYVEYDMSRENIEVLRVHDGVVDNFTEVTSKLTVPADKTFFKGPAGVYIYSQYFSDYLISSTAKVTPSPQPEHHSSRSNGGSVWLQDGQTAPTQVPTAVPTAVPGTDVTQMPTSVPTQPTQTSASPAPFIGILAGLGAAAAVAVLRRK